MGQSSWLWLPWVVILSGLGVGAAWLAWRAGRRATAVRRLGWATLPWAAWLLALFPLVTRVTDAFAGWATRFAFNPAAWIGMLLGVVGVALIVGSTRFGGAEQQPAQRRLRLPGRDRPHKDQPAVGRSGVTQDPELGEIDAILKRRGIS